jgi:chaperonin GroES
LKGDTVKTKIEPLHDYVVVRPLRAKQTPGGIIIPETAEKKTECGEVLAVGDGKYLDGEFRETTLKVGQEVFFNKFAGGELELDGETLRWIHETDVVAVRR